MCIETELVCVLVLLYAPGRTYASVDCEAGMEVGEGGATGVCRVKGLQLLIAEWYTDTDLTHRQPTLCNRLNVTDGVHRAMCK